MGVAKWCCVLLNHSVIGVSFSFKGKIILEYREKSGGGGWKACRIYGGEKKNLQP